MPRGAIVTSIRVIMFPSYSTQAWIGPLPRSYRFVNLQLLSSWNPAVLDLRELRLLTSMPTWLLSMSPNSVFWTVSSSTANMWLLEFPLLVELRRPMNWIGKALVKSVLGAMKKARPWPLMSENEERRSNTKETEKDCTVLSRECRKRSGDG